MDQKTNSVTEMPNSSESSSSSTPTTSAPNHFQRESNLQNAIARGWSLARPPLSPGPVPDPDDDARGLSCSRSSYNHVVTDYCGRYLNCVACGCEVDMAIVCYRCSVIYCRQDAASNIRVMTEKRYRHIYEEPDEQNEIGGILLSYTCNYCLGRKEADSKNWRGRKVLTLESICALSIGRKMWERAYETRKAVPSNYAMVNSLSIMKSMDKLFANTPQIIRNLIKEAIFLLGAGLELHFHGAIEMNDDPWLESAFVPTNRKSDVEFSRNESFCEGKRSFADGKIDDAVEINDSSADDDSDCWERHEIEWTPQFTIRDVDDYLGA